MTSLMIRLQAASVSAPSRPYPTSIRNVRSSFATTRSAPSSTFFRPGFHCSATRMAYCSIVSGAVEGTMRTATWLPFLASNDRNACSRADTCSPVRVAVRSVTRPPAGGTGTCAPAATARQSASASTIAPAVLTAILHLPFTPPPYGFDGAGAKSTLGGLATSFSFSTVKLGFGL